MKKIILMILFMPALLLADARQTISQVSRKTGGSLYEVSFQLQGSPLLVALTARNFKVLLRNVQLVLDNGSLLDITTNFPLDFKGQRFAYENQSVSTSISNSIAISGVKIVAESFGGVGSLDVDIQGLNLSGNSGSTVVPPPSLPPPANQQIVCATVTGGYRPTILGSNVTIGEGYFTQANGCNLSIQTQRRGYICAVDNRGYIGVYSTKTRALLGEYLTVGLDDCLSIINNGTRDLICAQGPQNDTAALFDLQSNRFIDSNYRAKAECFNSIQATNKFGPRPGIFPPPPPPIAQPQFICLSQGNGWFKVFNVQKNETLGVNSQQADCEHSIQGIKSGLMCVNSGNGWYKIFKIYTSEEIGGNVQRGTCEQLVASAQYGFVCSSQGNGWYKVQDIQRGATLGANSGQDACERSVRTANRGLMCVSSGNGWYKVFNMATGLELGSNVQQATCESSIR